MNTFQTYEMNKSLVNLKPTEVFVCAFLQNTEEKPWKIGDAFYFKRSFLP